MNANAVVEVAVPRPLRTTFDYIVPTTMAVPPVGARVRVPFGAATVVGVVAGRSGAFDRAQKEIEDVLDESPLLPADLTDLARWLARYYHHPIGDVFATLLPVKARRGSPATLMEEVVWHWTGSEEDGRLARAPRQREAFERLRNLGSAFDSELAALGLERRHLAALADKGLARSAILSPRYAVPATWTHQLTAEQAAAVATITATLDTPRTHLLDGVTGSGKTEVYLRVIAEVLRAGGQALVLVPEIALTPQTTARFKACFGAAATLHSGNTDAQRFDVWLKCAQGIHKVLIGTRSAVLAPFENLRLIVVDEEHDGSFKQGDGLRYSARDLAVKRGQMLKIPVVLGSATPSLESLENARRGRYERSRLPSRAGGASMPAMRIVDVRGTRLDRGFSEALHGAIGRHLDAGGQVLVFINRRGFAPVLLCSTCAWHAACEHCDAKLTLHRRPDRLRCHHCGYSRLPPRTCPACGASALVHVGTGTQRAEEALAERYPDVPRYRIDRDTTRSVRRLEADLEAIREGRPAILVGTQMLAKGHHLPNVTLVAVLDSDAGFLAADFRAPERTAQLIVQVAGRAGRAERPGEVWIQTFNPDNANLTALTNTGYAGFARNERRVRADAGMPPVSAVAMIRAESKVESKAWDLLAEMLGTLPAGRVEVLGPAPAPVARRAGHHRCQALVLASRRADLHRALDHLEAAEPKAAGVRWSIDLDPLDTF
ncbi:MAG: primosomal protein N' [Gammaproteobacteria bacterium]|nr:primosomal protein N' [Gammaproteobacteria bacterium]